MPQDDAYSRLEDRVYKLLDRAANTAQKLPTASVTVAPSDSDRAYRSADAIDLTRVDRDDIDLYLPSADRGDTRQLIVNMRQLAKDQSEQAEDDLKSQVGAAVGAATQVVGPSVSFKASEPDVLSKEARSDLIKYTERIGKFALWAAVAVGGLAGLASVFAAFVPWGRSVDLTAAGIVGGGFTLVALTSLIVSYFTVMGFKNVEYTGGVSGVNPSKEQGSGDEGAKDGDDHP